MIQFELDKINPDRPIEFYPGILALTTDDGYTLHVFDEIIAPLAEIDWDEYASIAEFGGARTLVIKIDGIDQPISLDADTSRVEEILDRSNIVDVYVDSHRRSSQHAPLRGITRTVSLSERGHIGRAVTIPLNYCACPKGVPL